MAYLPIRCAWTHFAPTHETLALDYDPPDRGRLVSVRLEVRDQAGTLVFRSDAIDCGGGPAPVSWTGALNQGNDANTEPHATPLRSPYKLKIDAVIEEDDEDELEQPQDLPNDQPSVQVHCALSQPSNPQPIAPQIVQQPPPPPPATEVTVRVLYHSIEIVRGPWLATGEVFVAQSAQILCDKLNQLGYYAGPPARAAANTDCLDKAKERFRRNHGALRANANPTALQVETQLDNEIGNHTARPTLTDHQSAEIAPGTAIPKGNGQPLRVYVEAVGFDEDLATPTDEFLQQVPDEEDDRSDLTHDWTPHANKTTSEARKLNRPFIPLEAVIYLKAHDDSRVSAPRAVGAVRVDWKCIEPGEDVSHLPQDDTVACGTRTYIHRLFESRYVHLEQDTNTNCPALYGGIRTQANNYRNPFWRGAQPYAPYAVPSDDNGGQTLYVPAYTDWNAHQARVGRSGIYFHPSLIAGDHYKVRASLSFAGQGNQVALEQANTNRAYETRPIVVWRRLEIFAIVGWPTRNYGNLAAKCRERYARAFHELDFSHTQFLRISQAINNGDFAAWMNHVQTHYYPAMNTLGAVLDLANVHDACPIIVQNGVNPDDTQQIRIKQVITNMFHEGYPQANTASAAGFLLGRIATRLRLGHPCGGVIFLEYKLSDEVRNLIQDAGVGGVPTTSNGNADLMGIIDQAVDANKDYVFAHELGHCFWLSHHENASGGVIPAHHDQYDHDCMMSYPYWGNGEPDYPHHAPNAYDPPFCGKCNLKLRGWNITHIDILSLDKPQAPDEIKALFYFDAADPGLHSDVELATVRGAFTAVSRGPFRVRNFDRNANFKTWIADLSDCDVYHHVTHGNVRCSSHGLRVGSMNIATPRYPTWCRSEKKYVLEMEDAERQICGDTNFDPATLAAWVTKKLIGHDPTWHTLRSVIQWIVDDDDSSQDIEFTYDQIKKALKAPPRILAFFSSCLLGWEKSFAKMFVEAGTAYVIAFRSRYETAQALEFSTVFYTLWKQRAFDPDMLVDCFVDAATARPHAEPVLFTKAMILRGYAQTMAPNSGKLRKLGWKDDKEFYEPLFPAR